MAYLHLLRSAQDEATPDATCLDAFERELDYIFSTLRRLHAPVDEVEDLAQEIFLVLHKNWATMDTTRPLRPYLYGIAFRVVSSHRRRHCREIPSPDLELEDTMPGTDSAIERRENDALIVAGLAHVPLARRAVVIMHDIDGRSLPEIAKTLSMTRFGVYARLKKGRNELLAAVQRLSTERT